MTTPDRPRPIVSAPLRQAFVAAFCYCLIVTGLFGVLIGPGRSLIAISIASFASVLLIRLVAETVDATRYRLWRWRSGRRR